MGKQSKRRMKPSIIFRLLHYWTKLICINPLTLSDENELRSSNYSTVYGILLIICYSYVWYYVLTDRLKKLFPGETPIVVIGILITMISAFLESAQTLFVFAFYQNRIKYVVKSFVKVERTSMKLNIRIDNERCLKKLAIYLTAITIAYISWMMFNILPLIFDKGSNNLMWICYILPQITSVNRWTIFMWILVIVKETYKRVNDEVRFLILNDWAKMSKDNGVNSRLTMMSKCKTYILDDKIQLIGQLHRELRDVIYRTVEHIVVCVLMNILTQFLNMTISVHIAYRFLKEYEQITVVNVRYIAGASMWTFFPIGILAVISNICGSTADEANKTVKIVHTVHNNTDDLDENREAAKFNVLSLDLLQNQLRISALGFFDLNYYLVYKAVTGSTSLLMIMLQFYN